MNTTTRPPSHKAAVVRRPASAEGYGGPPKQCESRSFSEGGCARWLTFWSVIVTIGSTATAVRTSAGVVVWRADNLKAVGGYALTVDGAPRVVETDIGPAVEFDGISDGLFIEVNPIAGLERFTIEVLFQPAADGPEEQRFLHIEDASTGSRALIELRMLPGGRWSLDTFLRANEKGLTLLERGNAHPAGRWHSAALTYDGRTMAHYVDGVRELSGEIAFPPTGAGRISLGVRQNRVSWFKGRIHSIRITPDALPAERLQRPPADPAAMPQTQSTVIPLTKLTTNTMATETGTLNWNYRVHRVIVIVVPAVLRER